MSEIVLASNQLAARLGVEKGHMLATIKAQCFPNMNPDNVSDTMLAAFVQVAQSLNLNPLLPGMVYAYPAKNGGITPIIGPDGIFQLLTNNPDIEGWSVKHEEIDGEKAATATIKHKRLGDISKTVFLSEWKVPNNPNWTARPRHMLEIRALKQAARQIVHGIPFDEEERKIADEVNVTGTGDEAQQAAPERPKAPARRGGAAAAMASAETPASDPKAEPKAETAPTIEAEIVDDAPAQDDAKAKAERDEIRAKELARQKAEEKAKADAEAAAKSAAAKAAKEAAPDLSQVPEVCPGVSITGFKGKNWPCVMSATINAITAVAAAKPYLKLTVATHAPAEAEITIATYEHVTVKDGKAEITADFIKTGNTIEFSAEAKLMPSKTPDPANPGKKLPDLTKAPAIMATGITEGVVEF